MTSSDQRPQPGSRLAALFVELRRRRVIRTTLYYLGGAVAAVEAAGAFAGPLGLPDALVRGIAVLAVAGLPLAVALSWAYDISTDGSVEPSPLGRAGRALSATGGALISVALAFVLWRGGFAASPAPEPEAVVTNRIAVLPLEAPGQSEELRVLAEHLHGRLIDGLSDAVAAPGVAEADRLHVISRAGVLPFVGGRVTVDSIGRALSAGLIVEGSLEGARDSVRIRLRLIDAGTADLLDSRVASAPNDDPIELADNLGEAALTMLRERLGDLLRERTRRLGTRSAEAFRHVVWADAMRDEFIRAMERRDPAGARRALRDADSLYQEAARLDPNWAEPLVLQGFLSDQRAQLSTTEGAGDTGYRAIYEQARTLGDQALRRDPSDGRALYLRGSMSALLSTGADTPEEARRLRESAEADLRAAILGNPTPAPALRSLSQLLANQGRYEEALELGDRAYAEDRYLQNVAPTLLRLFEYSMRLERDDDALRHCTEGRRRFPGTAVFEDCWLVLMAWSPVVEARADSARLAVARELEGYPAGLRPLLEPRLQAHLAAILATVGQADSARALLARARASDSESGGVALPSAGTWALLGDTAAALAEVRALLARSPNQASGLRTAPELRPLRGSAALDALIDSVAGPPFD